MNEIEYCEKNSIARGVWNVSQTSYKIISYACFLLLSDGSTDWVEFKMKDLLKALGIADGKKTREIINVSLEQVFSAYIEYEIKPDTWIKQHWFQNMVYKKDWTLCRLKFNPDIVPYLREKNNFFIKNLSDIAKLKSSYAISFYTIGQSYSGFAGKNGNAPGTWYFTFDMQKLKKILSVKQNEYADNYEFFRRCIKAPLEEINKKNLAFSIMAEKIKDGKEITGYRFECKSKNLDWVNFVDEMKTKNLLG